MYDLWFDENPDSWRAALNNYDAVIARQGSKRLPSHDRWYREELPSTITSRRPPFVTLDELAKITEWKMARGTWRQRNLVLVRSNSPELVEETSQRGIVQHSGRQEADIHFVSTVRRRAGDGFSGGRSDGS